MYLKNRINFYSKVISMKFLLMLFVGILCTSCFDKSEDIDSSVKQTESIDVKPVVEEVITQEDSDKNASTSVPNISDYPRECPKAWGVVKGASQTQVENFIQNYFHVPENPTPMYSEINHYSQPDGSTLIQAGTYKMQDNIVDQEMVTSFVAGNMTQCGVRLRCANNPSEWVDSCD